MSLWDALRALPLQIESYAFERVAATQAYGFERITTRVRLSGGGVDGLGEDVSAYDTEDNTLHVTNPSLPLTGEWTLESFCDQLTELDQWSVAPEYDIARRWRNWAFESAALDLALNQAGRPLHEIVGHEPAPLRFVNSLGLGDPPTFDPIAAPARRPPRTALQARRGVGVDARADRSGGRHGRRGDHRLQGPVRDGVRRAGGPAGDVRAGDRGVPGRTARGRARPARRSPSCSRRRRTGSPTTRRSTRSRISTRRR